MAVAAVVEVDLVDLVHHLTQQLARLHVIEGVFKYLLDDVAARIAHRIGIQALELGEERVVDEVLQFFTGHSLCIGRPVAPAQVVGDGRLVAVAQQLKLRFLIVEDFQEEQPGKLGNPLRVAIDASILAHDVLDGFDEGGADGHAVLLSYS